MSVAAPVAGLNEILRAPAVMLRYPRPRPRSRFSWRRAATLALVLLLLAPEISELRVQEDRVGGWLLTQYDNLSVAVQRVAGTGSGYTHVGQNAGWDLPYACMRSCPVGDDSCYLACFDQAWPGGEATMPADAREIRQEILRRLGR